MSLEVFAILVSIGIFFGSLSFILNRKVSIKAAYMPILFLTLVLIVLDLVILFQYDSSNYWGFLAILILSYPYGIIVITLFLTWYLLERIFPTE